MKNETAVSKVIMAMETRCTHNVPQFCVIPVMKKDTAVRKVIFIMKTRCTYDVPRLCFHRIVFISLIQRSL